MASFLLSIGSDPHHDPSGIQPTPSDLAWDLWLRGVVPSTEELFIRPLLHHSDFVEEQNFPLVHRIVLGLSFKDLDHELLANPDAVFAVDTQGRTALSWAACRGDALSCAKLIKSGADANTLDKHGKSPLYLAVNSEHKTQNAVVRVLLAGGAETDQKLFNAGVIRSTPLLCSANEATDILVLKSLLDFGAKLEAKNRAGATPLIIVARSKPVTFTALLLAYGANLHAKDNDGNTVLTTAIKYNNHDVLRLLLDRWFRYTACPRARNMDILHAAAESADLETMGILVIAGAWGLRGDGADKRGQTAREIFEKRKNKTPELELIFRKLLRAIRATKTDVDEVRLLEAGLLQEWSWPSRRKSSLQEDLKLFEIAGKHGMLIAVDEMAVEDDDDTEDDADEKFEEAVEHLVQV